MSNQKSSFGQSDIVRLSDEDAAVALLERAVTGLWEVVNELTRFRRTTRQNYRRPGVRTPDLLLAAASLYDRF
jgi:hypothetical protein